MAELLNNDLPAFLRQAAAQPFAYGDWDCALTLANWVRAATGVDPAPALRGAYGSERGYRRLLVAQGGLEALVDALAAAAGLRRIAPDEALSGDIGLVDVPTRGLTGAIRSTDFWAIKLARPLTFVKVAAVAAWRLPDEEESFLLPGRGDAAPRLLEGAPCRM
jgi:hypothetical protein